MKEFYKLLILSLLVVGCVPSEIEPSSIPSPLPPTSTTTPTFKTTSILTTTPTITPSPTLALPVEYLTPIPSSNTKITAENVNGIQEIARFYSQLDYFAKLTDNQKFLFILDPDGITEYDYVSMQEIAYIPLANSASDFQMSNDGSFLMIDEHWLVDIRNENEPSIHDLTTELKLEDGYAKIFSLSPDGMLLAVSGYSCDGGCVWSFHLVSLNDFSVKYYSDGRNTQELFGFSPTFSQDGSFIAIDNPIYEVDNRGNGHIISETVNIWSTKTVEKVTSIKVDKTDRTSSVAFSHDNNLIAIAKGNYIEIYNVLDGSIKTKFRNLCKSSSERKIMFSPTSEIRLLENSTCSSNIWTISGSRAYVSGINAPDFSKIAFDEKGNFKALSYPYPQSNYGIWPRNLKFINNETLGFKSRIEKTTNNNSCILFLDEGSFSCLSSSGGYKNGRVLGKDIILATDGKYYNYDFGKESVEIYSSTDPDQLIYSIPYKQYAFSLLALDTINDIIFYNIALDTHINKVFIQDMTNNRILGKWEGETYISNITFSENKEYAAFCRSKGYTTYLNIDKLEILDLNEKTIVYREDFTCYGVSMDMTKGGNKLAIAYYYRRNPSDKHYSSKVEIRNTLPPFDKVYFDDASSSHAVAFSPDDSILAVTCGDRYICFLDTSNGKEIYRLNAHTNIDNLAFSDDGTILATSSRWGLMSLWATPPYNYEKRDSTQPESFSFSILQPTAVPTNVTHTSNSTDSGSFTIEADKKWKDTNRLVGAGETISIGYISGEWRSSPDYSWGNGFNCSGTCSDCLLPTAPEESLIARVGDGDPFCVGLSSSHISDINGILFLSFNDCPADSCYSDNEGGLEVKVEIK